MQVEAIYRHGVFEPLEPVNLREEQRVTLAVASSSKKSMEGWLKKVHKLHDEVIKKNGGFLPDSTPDIAADRMR